MTYRPTATAPADHYFRPERPSRLDDFFSRLGHRFCGAFVMPLRSRVGRLQAIVPEVERHAAEIAAWSDSRLQAEATALRYRMAGQGYTLATAGRVFALVREAADRHLGLRHFPSQLLGGWAMLQGMVAEMETGEGKTLTATLTAATAALAGMPVHVITVNDYLTARDAQNMRPVYQALGLTVGCVTHEELPPARRAAYLCDIVYCTNKELVFDYLKDRLHLGDRLEPLQLFAEELQGGRRRVDDLLLRGLHFGIVDEADSVLVDEARTPLIISGNAKDGGEKKFYQEATAFAAELQEGVDFRLGAGTREIQLTAQGCRRLAELAAQGGGVWAGTLRREETVKQALSARYLFHRDEEYLVRDGKVQIIDGFTGRVMADRTWEKGLHQLIEIKEGCEMTGQRETRARISYQRFFRRYLQLGGMTGTAREVAGELWSVYRLPTVKIPTHQPCRRQATGDRIFRHAAEKWQTLVSRVQELHRQGRPILIGTGSVAASEEVCQLLQQAGLEPRVLNAKFDQEEAEIVAGAGESGCITIATNMAGRGTDIKLGAGVAQTGGLHVILTERHEAARIDRQLFGRCARQGDPGSYEMILSLEDSLVRENLGRWATVSLAAVSRFQRNWAYAALAVMAKEQKKVERRHARIRRNLLRQDEREGMLLSFSGRQE